ncbi:MAG TPA: class I SAM-dependent rRNA methyltransferase [Acidobacteriota bacterium]|nr:class I SAM-dependent rRNA methyltransferase [Acidobacteriota bacterium]
MKMLPVAVISQRARKRLKGKHPWIFSNELEIRPQALAGDLVQVQDNAGKFVAVGYYNPHTLIAVRILSHTHHEFDLTERIKTALALRRQVYRTDIYRLIYSESDGLPGLIVDRYDATLVVQILTAGMERMREQIISSLVEVVNPQRIQLRNDSDYRKLEGLSIESCWVFGEKIDRQVMELDGLQFIVPFEEGQKTGFFLDQQENRRRLLQHADGKNMLDAFCYTGAWSLYGAKAGLQSITAVDTSEAALNILRQNANLNGAAIEAVNADVFDFLRSKYDGSERFDLIVLDPPAFCKSKRHLREALKGYREINLRAMKLLSRHGFLFTCSCSQPVASETFIEVLRAAGGDSGRSFHIREILHHPQDHPVLLGFPESQYLKCVVLQVV